jgi:hypothetical protein
MVAVVNLYVSERARVTNTRIAGGGTATTPIFVFNHFDLL